VINIHIFNTCAYNWNKKKILTVRIQGVESFNISIICLFTVFCVQGRVVGSSNHWPCTCIFVYESVI
jgi:hypothetical protein